jgi:hypothetical protein
VFVIAQDESDDDIDDDSGGDSEQRSVDSQSVDSRSTTGAQENRLSQSHTRNAAATTTSSVTAAAVSGPQSRGGRRNRRRPVSEEWEILEGLKSGQHFELALPQKFGGYIMKSRKWPMKGWHKVLYLQACCRVNCINGWIALQKDFNINLKMELE